jgi:spore coat protein H
MLVLVTGQSEYSGDAASPDQPSNTPWFSRGAVHRIQIELAPAAAEHLRREPREYVPATVKIADQTFPEVGLHLKGATGSFRPLDDKPGFTLDFGRFRHAQTALGLRKVHLDNSVEDPSHLHAQLGGELCRDAGVPAPRVAHARVTLNHRDLGLYLVAEGFTEDFLARHFARISGELYEPISGGDIDQPMKRDSVRAPETDPAGLRALADAALEPDLNRRWIRLQETLEIDRFLTFTALEVMLNHRDGYGLARNNFRVYHNLETGRMVFFPHGMDQLLGQTELPWQPHWAGLVTQALLETPMGGQRYAEVFRAIFHRWFNPQDLARRVDDLVLPLQPHLSRREFTRLQNESNGLKDRIALRHAQLERQLGQTPTPTAVFHQGVAKLTGWQKADAPMQGSMELGRSTDGIASLRIATRSATTASWRTTTRLEPGKYRFAGKARLLGFQPLPSSQHQGAGLRLGGHQRAPDSAATDPAWKELAADFEVRPGSAEVEFVCELRARTGEAWFDLDSLRVTQVP